MPAPHETSSASAEDLHKTSAGRCYERLKADIITGRLVPGSRLRIADMAKKYDGGQIPIREALNRLTAEALVAYSDQRGFAVAAVSAEELDDLTRARNMVTEAAIRESMRLGDAAWEERVLVASHRLSKVPRYTNEDPPTPNPAYEAPHRAFHLALVSGCESQWMVDVVARLFDHADRYRHLSRKVVLRSRDDEHDAIAKAVLRRDPDAAVRLLKAHGELTANLVLLNNSSLG